MDLRSSRTSILYGRQQDLPSTTAGFRCTFDWLRKVVRCALKLEMTGRTRERTSPSTFTKFHLSLLMSLQYLQRHCTLWNTHSWMPSTQVWYM